MELNPLAKRLRLAVEDIFTSYTETDVVFSLKSTFFYITVRYSMTWKTLMCAPDTLSLTVTRFLVWQKSYFPLYCFSTVFYFSCINYPSFTTSFYVLLVKKGGETDGSPGASLQMLLIRAIWEGKGQTLSKGPSELIISLLLYKESTIITS